MRLPQFQHTSRLAVTGTLIAVGLAFLPYCYGRREYSAELALNCLSVVAVIWATKYAADNLFALFRVQADALEPLLSLVLEQLHTGKLNIMGTLFNHGQGMAIGVTVTAWLPDSDGDLSPEPIPVPLPAAMGNGASLPFSIDYDIATRWQHSGYFAVQVHYDSASNQREHRQWFFETTDKGPLLSPIRLLEPDYLERKWIKLNNAANVLALAHRRDLPRLFVSIRPNGRAIVIEIIVDGAKETEAVSTRISVSEAAARAQAMIVETQRRRRISSRTTRS